MLKLVYLAMFGPVALLIIFGVAIRFFKAYWLISGYNTMSKEKKENVDTERLGKFIGNIMFAIAGVFAVAAILLLLNQNVAAGIVFALMLPLLIYTIIAAQKYDGNNRTAEGKMKKSSKIILGSIILFLVVVSAGVGVLIYNGSQPTVIKVDQGYIKIAGLYGEDVPIANISSMDLFSAMPEILTRTNGSAIGTSLKGHFDVMGVGSALLFLDTSKPPFIYIRTASKVYYFNTDDADKTKALFNEIQTI